MSDIDRSEGAVPSASGFKQCPECGFATPVVNQQCPQCGHKYRTQFKPVDAAPKPVNKTTTIGCVNCGNADVRKLSASERQSGTLSSRLLPPVRPEYAAPKVTMLAAGSAALLIVALVALGITGVSNTVVVILAALLAVLAVVSGLVAVQETKFARKQFADDERKYEEAMKQWNLLFYCPKCDSVYDLATRKFAPAATAHTLLGRH